MRKKVLVLSLAMVALSGMAQTNLSSGIDR